MAEVPLLAARGLFHEYRLRTGAGAVRRVEALRGVDLDLGAGRTLALVGPSGCGKSTLARCLAGLERPTAGQVRLKGDDVFAPSRAPHLRRAVQLVFQDTADALDPRFDAAEIVAEPLEVAGVARAARHRRARELMERVGLPPALASRRARELSGGQRQRLAVARALAADPLVVILDEAFSGLDASVQAYLALLLQGLQAERGLAYVLITHDLALAGVLADEVAVMLDGRVVERGPAESVLTAPRHERTRALVQAAGWLALPLNPLT